MSNKNWLDIFQNRPKRCCKAFTEQLTEKPLGTNSANETKLQELLHWD